MPGEQISVVDFRVELADALVRMWRQSFETAVGVKERHPFQEQREFLLTEIMPSNAVRVVCHGADVVGFIAASRESISQLYLSESYQRRGIGTMLLDWAKAQSNGTLSLHTFARNVAAQRFYERNGFKLVARGFEPERKLDDLKYEWVR